MAPTLHIITSCTQRKSLSSQPSTKLSNFTHLENLSERCDAWFESLRNYDQVQKTCIDLYQGDHWSSSLAATDLATQCGVDVCLWVCSAGVGLVSGETTLPPYSATFSANQLNTVSRNVVDASKGSNIEQIWWSLLCEQSFGHHPRSLSDLFETNKQDTFLVIMSQNYLNAVALDLQQALQHLSSKGDCTVFSVGGRGDWLEPYMVKADARLQQVVGGTLTALNARIARHCISSTEPDEWNSQSWKKITAHLMDTLPPYTSPKRTTMSDEELINFITSSLNDDPKWSKTKLLQHLRKVQGKACEQKRFGSLYQQAATAYLNK